MKILAIDPSSNRFESSTTGVVLLDNAKLVDYWVVPYGAENFKKWFQDTGKNIEADRIVIEQYKVFENDRARDNSTQETMQMIAYLYRDRDVFLQSNTGYVSDIPDALLKAINLYDIGSKDHHDDVRAAARIGLFHAMRNDLKEVVQDIGFRAMG